MREPPRINPEQIRAGDRIRVVEEFTANRDRQQLSDSYNDIAHYLIERPGGSTPTETEPIDVWLRILDGEDEAEAEANTYLTEEGYRVDWYLTAVGLVTSVEFDTLADAYDWLEREGFANYSTEVNP